MSLQGHISDAWCRAIDEIPIIDRRYALRRLEILTGRSREGARVNLYELAKRVGWSES